VGDKKHGFGGDIGRKEISLKTVSVEGMTILKYILKE